MVFKGGFNTIGNYLIHPDPKPGGQPFFKKIFEKFSLELFVEKLVFFKTLDHHIPKMAWLTSVKFWNMNICLNLSNFS